MNLYEQAICYFAYSHPVIFAVDGFFTANDFASGLPFMLAFWRVFPELHKNGMVEQVERWPYPMWAASNACIKKAVELWNQHGYKPVWIAPGCVDIHA